jgi:hypothetical protein
MKHKRRNKKIFSILCNLGLCEINEFWSLEIEKNFLNNSSLLLEITLEGKKAPIPKNLSVDNVLENLSK